MTYFLDDIDKKILKILQEDARTPFSKIAKTLNLSESTIHIRIKRLKENGVIKGFYVDIDPEKIGYNVIAFVLIKADPKKYESILKRITELKEVNEIYDVTGEYYALLKVRVRTREELASVLDKIGNMDGVTSTYTMIVLRTVKEMKNVDFS